MKYIGLTPMDIQWMDEDPIAYAGPWCTESKSRKSANVIESWSSEEELFQLVEKAQHTYNEIIPYVCIAMNKAHGVSKSKRYWEILLEYNLRFQIDILIDRHYRLKSICKEYPSSSVIILEENDYEYCTDTRNFKKKALFSSKYNLQLFSQMVYDEKIKTKDIIKIGGKWGRKISTRVKHYKRAIQNLYKAKSNVGTASTLVCEFGLTPKETRRVSKYAKSNIGYFSHNIYQEIPVPDPELRSVFNGDCGLNGFSLQVFRALQWNLPLSYLEGYKRVRRYVQRDRDPPELIIQGNPKGDPPTRIWVAECVEKGSKLATVQHGAAYGEVNYSPHEIFERSSSDFYLTWGWAHEEEDHPLPSPKLSSVSQDRSRHISSEDGSSRGGVLWLSRDARLYRRNGYPLRLAAQYNLGPPERHIRGVFSYANHLSEEVAEQTTLRLKPWVFEELKDFEEELRETLAEQLGRISLDKGDRSVAEEAQTAQLVVIDHFPSTSFLECLVLGVPVVVFNTIPLDRIREETRPYVEALHQCDVLHENADSAAQLTNDLYKAGRIVSWWHQEERRKIVSDYRDRYAYAADSFVEEWAEFVDGVVQDDYSNQKNIESNGVEFGAKS